jgi:hypothetical protein
MAILTLVVNVNNNINNNNNNINQESNTLKLFFSKGTLS